MSNIDFSEHSYMPVLSGDDVSEIAFQRLSDDCKDTILPLFELSRHRRATDFSPSAQVIADINASQFLIDLDKRVAPDPYRSRNPSDPAAEEARIERETADNEAFNSALSALLDPSDGFGNWRRFCNQFPNAVPVLQFTNPTGQRNPIIRQAAMLLRSHERIAMRIQRNQSEIVAELAVQILSIAPNSGQVLIICDCGYARRNYLERAEWAAEIISSITDELDRQQIARLSAVCMSNSYPQPNHDGIRIVENYDREVWVEACNNFPFAFGDYAATSRPATLSAYVPRNYRATVVHTTDEQWLIHRDENSDDPEGWRRGCEIIAAHESFDPIDSWADERITAVSNHGISEAERPKDWHALRISGHIERQCRIESPDDLE